MKERLLLLYGILLVSALSVCGQEGSRPLNTHPDDRKRIAELLKHPTFIQLRLLSIPRDAPREASTGTPAPYHVKDWIGFRLLASQSSFEEIPVPVFRWPYTETRPTLMKDGDIVPYSKQAEAAVQRAEELFGPGHELKLRSGVEHELQDIRLNDWYEPLAPGRFELVVRRRFDWHGDWINSTPIYFEVRHRVVTDIPTGVTVELVPEGIQPMKDGSYQLSTNTIIRVLVRNDSGHPVKVGAVDLYYSVRPQLFRGDAVVPHGSETEKLLAARKENPNVSELPKEFFLDPGTKTGVVYIKLSDWYNRLPAGSYRLVTRQRFEIDGPWTPESAPLLFEVVASKDK